MISAKSHFLWTRPESTLLARIYLNSRVQTSTLRTSLIPLPLELPSKHLTMRKYSPSSNAGMASLQEKVGAPWTARVCSSDQPTYTECCSQTKCEQPVWKSFISSRTAPYHYSHLPACMLANGEAPAWSLEIRGCPTSGAWGELPGWTRSV